MISPGREMSWGAGRGGTCLSSPECERFGEDSFEFAATLGYTGSTGRDLR